MFTIEQIKTAHAKVKSGADFPKYIQEILKLGVVSYETFVNDNHSEYYSEKGKEVASARNDHSLNVSGKPSLDEFKIRLKLHQQGGTDYQTFRQDCASHGVNKWIVDLTAMTCAYYDLAGEVVLEERIPS